MIGCDCLEQTKPKKNKWISFLADAMLSGMMIGIGGMVSLSSENRYMGALLFSLGLFCIVQFQYGLYTGKVGYLVNRELSYIAEVVVTLLGNALGTLVTALLLRQVRFFTTNVSNLDVTISDRVNTTILAKLNDNPISILVLAIFCGILMFTAVEGSRKCKESQNFVGGLFVVVMPIMVFIICGFNHCIADMFYYFLAGCPQPAKAAIYFPLVIIGNGIGGVIIPLLKKLSNNSL
jgi:formate/nitrite transporter FocA (FNT family)